MPYVEELTSDPKEEYPEGQAEHEAVKAVCSVGRARFRASVFAHYLCYRSGKVTIGGAVKCRLAGTRQSTAPVFGEAHGSNDGCSRHGYNLVEQAVPRIWLTRASLQALDHRPIAMTRRQEAMSFVTAEVVRHAAAVGTAICRDVVLVAHVPQ